MKSKKKRKQIIALSGKHFQTRIENVHDGIVIYDSSGKIEYASKSVKKVCGFIPFEMIGKSGAWFIHRDEREKTGKSFWTFLKKPRKSIGLFQRIKQKKGFYIWSEAVLTNFTLVPEIQGMFSNFRDITEKFLTKKKLTEHNIRSNPLVGIYPREYL